MDSGVARRAQDRGQAREPRTASGPGGPAGTGRGPGCRVLRDAYRSESVGNGFWTAGRVGGGRGTDRHGPKDRHTRSARRKRTTPSVGGRAQWRYRTPELDRRLSSRAWRPGIGDRASRVSRPGVGTSVLPGPACDPGCLGYALRWFGAPLKPRGTGSQPATRGGAMLRRARFGTDKSSEKQRKGSHPPFAGRDSDHS